MKIINCEQGSEEWFSARCGIPSASNFDKIVTLKGEPSKQREKYLFTLAAERISGKKEETYSNFAMQRGIELEDEARKYYEMDKNVEIEQVGFCLSDDGTYGCSPDGLVYPEDGHGLVEIKCPLAHTHIGYLIDGKMPSTYFQQVQGQILVTGADWCDFISYYPGVKPFLIRVKKDEVFIKKLENELKLFTKELNEIVKKIGE